MSQHRNRWWPALGLFAWVVVSAGALVGILFLSWYRDSADYPGALRVADRTIYEFNPLYIRRDASYRSGDKFNRIYNWYSVGFELGPEMHAQGVCSLMSKSFSDFGILERDMSVMVCDTPKGRLIFVMRALSVHWR